MKIFLYVCILTFFFLTAQLPVTEKILDGKLSLDDKGQDVLGDCFYVMDCDDIHITDGKDIDEDDTPADEEDASELVITGVKKKLISEVSIMSLAPFTSHNFYTIGYYIFDLTSSILFVISVGEETCGGSNSTFRQIEKKAEQYELHPCQ